MMGLLLVLETIFRHMKDKKVIGISQHGFMKGKSCLINMRAFSHEMTCQVEEGRVADVYLDFSKAFGAVSCKNLKDRRMKYRLDKSTVRWTEN